MKRLAIIGAGELGKQIFELSENDPEITVAGFFDDIIPINTVIISNQKVIGTTKDILPFYNSNLFDFLMIGIGYRYIQKRKFFFDKFSPTIAFARIIHSSCIIHTSAIIGAGVAIYPGCIIDKNVVIGNNVLLNLGSVVAHDSVIGAHSFIAPRVTFSGFVKLDELNFVGTGSILIDNISVASNCTLGAGTVVIKDINNQGVYVGNPAKKI